MDQPISAAEGHTFTVTSRGRPVARIVPFDDGADRGRRREAWREFIARLEAQPAAEVDSARNWTREELYERD